MKSVLSLFTQLVIGLIFGAGLVISGMSDPAKVLSFLDLAAIPTGGWDPSLILVMLSGVGTAFVGFKLVLRQSRPVFDETFHLPATSKIDRRILVGPAIFGIGWGLAGFCPGPAFTALSGGGIAVYVFMIMMLMGMGCARLLDV